MLIQHAIAKQMGWEPQGKPGGRQIGDTCGWCDETGPQWKAVPVTFTQWSLTGIDPARPWLCALCAAAMAAVKPVKWWPMQVTAETSDMARDPRELMSWLSRPVTPDRAVLVPTNRLKRPLLGAAWGTVSTSYDVAGYRWDTTDTERLQAYDQLRWTHGVSQAEIAEPAPRPKTLIDSPDPSELITLWDKVKTWDPIRLEIAMLATRRTEV